MPVVKAEDRLSLFASVQINAVDRDALRNFSLAEFLVPLELPHIQGVELQSGLNFLAELEFAYGLADPTDLPRILANALPADSLVAVSMRAPSDKERKRYSPLGENGRVILEHPFGERVT